MRSFRLLPLFVAALATVLGLSGPADAMEDLSSALPADTLAYLRTAGADALLDEIGSMSKLDPKQVLVGLYREAIEAGLSELSKDTGIETGEFLVALHSVQGVHFALFNISRDGEDVDFVAALETSMPDVMRGLFDRIFGEAASFAGEVAGTRVHALSFEENAPVVYVAFHDLMVLVSTRPDRISGVIEGLASPAEVSLAKLPQFKSAQLRTGTDATAIAWVDVQKLLKLIESTQGRRGREEFREVSRIAELWRLKAATVVSGGGGTRARITFSPGHRWLSAIRGSPITEGLAAYVPSDAVFFAVDGGSVKEKMTALLALIQDEKTFPDAAEVTRDRTEMEDAIGFGLDEYWEALGDEWALFIPQEKDLPVGDDDATVIIVQIGDQEKLDSLIDRFLVSPAGQNLEQDAGRIEDVEYEGARMIYPDYGEDDEVPCMAIHGNVLLMAGNRQAIKSAIDAKNSGTNAISAARGSFSSLSGAFTKIGAMSLDTILMEEWEFTPLLDLVPDRILLAAAIDEGPGRLDIRVNQPAFGLMMFLTGGELVTDRYRRESGDCMDNLLAVYRAIEKYRAETGKDPASLEALVPDHLAKSRLVCPLDSGEGVPCSYRLATRTSEERGDWSILGWCRHRLHRRIVLRANGDVDTIRERSFIRELHYQGVKIKLR